MLADAGSLCSLFGLQRRCSGGGGGGDGGGDDGAPLVVMVVHHWCWCDRIVEHPCCGAVTSNKWLLEKLLVSSALQTELQMKIEKFHKFGDKLKTCSRLISYQNICKQFRAWPFDNIKRMNLWINVLLWIFNFLGSWCRRRITLTLFLRFKCSNGKTDSPKSGIHNFGEEPFDCWERLWFEAELGFCSFIETSLQPELTSTPCCCRQINSQLLISDWENQISRKPRGRKYLFPISPFLRPILRTACKYLAFQIVLWNK